MALLTPGMVSTDDRPLLERLRRCQLWQIADKVGLPYPPGAAKTVMVQLLQATGVDPTQHIEFQPVHGRDENGQPTVEYYPVIPDHATSGKAIDYDSKISERIQGKDEPETDSFDAARYEALERKNESLEKRLDQLLDKLGGDEPQTNTVAELPFKLTLGQKKQLLGSRGISTKGMSREDIDKALEE